jgi:hypothetical protein
LPNRARAEPSTRIDIPFSFTARGVTFPAGRYSIELELNQGFITLVNAADFRKNVLFLAIPADKTGHEAIIKFHLVGTTHVLRSVQIERRISHEFDTSDDPQTNPTTSIAER